MQSKLLSFLRANGMGNPGERVICAVSGGADSMALLHGMYLLQEKLGITVEAAHFNHKLRGAESDRDEAFVRDFCAEREIPLHVGSARVEAGEKGLEAAAREARYAFLQSLPGIIATAHTADDNAETLLMHLVRGTGLKGLGGITPKTDRLIRPMLAVTRQEVLAFLAAQNIPYVTDSSNETDDFLRNRIRHHVMPLLKAENPSLAENLSATALRLRQDAQTLDTMTVVTNEIAVLRQMPPALQNRALQKLLLDYGVKEPEAAHVEQLRKLAFSENPSAYGIFHGVPIGRAYDRLVRMEVLPPLEEVVIPYPGEITIGELGIKVICAKELTDGDPVQIHGTLILRSRREGDTIRLPGGTKTLKKLMIDRKIPAAQRSRVPVLADDMGVVAVMGIGIDQNHREDPNMVIRFEKL